MDDVQNNLDVIGKEGWQLVSAQDITLQDGRIFTASNLKQAGQTLVQIRSILQLSFDLKVIEFVVFR
jgi:hypothetical protein